MPKRHYRVRNWKEYNESLVQRGSVTFWMDEKVLSQRYSKQKLAKRGRPLQYVDVAIEMALTLRAIFHLRSRATEGFMQSLFEWAKLPLKTPDYTTLCKRQKTLEEVKLLRQNAKQIPQTRKAQVYMIAQYVKIFIWLLSYNASWLLVFLEPVVGVPVCSGFF